MKKLVGNLALLAIGAGLCWLFTDIREGLNAQSSGVPPQGNYQQGNYPLNPNDNSGLLSPVVNPQLAGSQTTVPRPLEVPPVYAFGTMIDPSCLQIAIVDAPNKQMSVYWVQKEGNGSSIEFKASRTFEWDHLMKEYNVRGMTPEEIQDMSRQK